MRAGKLRHPVTIETATESQDEYGATTLSWSKLADVWAAIEPLRGRERFEAQHHAIEEDTRIRIRHRDDVTAEDRVVARDGTVYGIRGVLDVDGLGEELHLQCLKQE